MAKLELEERFFQTVLTAAKVKFECNLITDSASNKRSTIYRYISHIWKGDATPSTISYDYAMATLDEDSANLFNSYTSTQYSLRVYSLYLNPWNPCMVVLK